MHNSQQMKDALKSVVDRILRNDVEVIKLQHHAKETISHQYHESSGNTDFRSSLITSTITITYKKSGDEQCKLSS